MDGADNDSANPLRTKRNPDMDIILQPSDPESVMNHVQKINELADSLVLGDDSTRIQLVEEARSLARALETPRETMCRHCVAQVRV